MAIAKLLSETYLCETDDDRNSIPHPYKGQRCIMQNGDLYVCIVEGIWSKIGGDTPIPAHDNWNALSTATWGDLMKFTWGQLI